MVDYDVYVFFLFFCVVLKKKEEGRFHFTTSHASSSVPVCQSRPGKVGLDLWGASSHPLPGVGALKSNWKNSMNFKFEEFKLNLDKFHFYFIIF